MDGSMLKILKITNALRNENDINTLLGLIIDNAMDLANCEAGTLYLSDDHYLYFQVIRNRKLNEYNKDRGECNLPRVPNKPEYACALSLIKGEMLFINDAYKETTEYCLEGPIVYDSRSGYHTSSMMIVPLISRDGTKMGVLQLLNALGEAGTYIPFSEEQKPFLQFFADQATVALENAKVRAQLKGLKWIVNSDSFEGELSEQIMNQIHQYVNKNYCKTLDPETLEDYLKRHQKKEKKNVSTDISSDAFASQVTSQVEQAVRESAIDKLQNYVVQSKLKDAEIARRAGIGRSTFYNLEYGKRSITKNNMFAIAIALTLTTQQLEELLMLNGYCFRPDDKRDLTIRFLFQENDKRTSNMKMDLYQFNLILYRLGYELLGEKQR